MSSSFKTVAELIQETPTLPQLLKDADRYFAHVHPHKAPELYEEHFDRVNQYFGQICAVNGLDPVIDRLITEVVSSLFPKSPALEIGILLKSLFVKTAVFHDFGKINENFQGHPQKMNNPAFLSKVDKHNPLKHHHSKLGAYLYVVKHFSEGYELPFISPEEKRTLYIVILMLSYPIFKHHATGLLRPDGQGIAFNEEELDYMQRYLKAYGLEVPLQLSKTVLTSVVLEQNFLSHVFKEESVQFSFAFFALLRLNFSLLTAADYLATGQYTYDLSLESKRDWGLLDESLRQRIITAAHSNPEKVYNGMAYTYWEQKKQGTYALEHPTEASGQNLNTLRTEMAVQVLEQLSTQRNQRLFYLEAPTGGGKTNLSMLAVAELLKANPEISKVFYVFPFTTLITQTHRAIKETLLLTDEEIALLHSRTGFQTKGNWANSTEEKEDGLYGEQRKDFLQNLFALYPFTLITHVRFFDIIKSNRKEDIYLMHRLANSIVILDELQSYPPRQWDKMLYLLDQYSRAFNIRFLLMSATLPRLDQIDAVKKATGGLPPIVDLLPDPKRYFRNANFKGRVDFRFDLLTPEDISMDTLAATVLEKSQQRALANDGRVFTIIEFIFKKSATEFSQVLAGLESVAPFFGPNIFVLSGTILESQRRKIINYLKRNRRAENLKVLLITTQVVEAGVDIDMDLGFKNVSLIDSDEQLAGRVNRNVDKENCEVYLFRKDDPMVLYKSDYRYQITHDLDRSFHQEILESKDFGRLYERVFEEIEKKNRSEMVENFERNYLGYFQKLDFPEINRKLPIIDQQTLSVFVPLALPIALEDEKGNHEVFFDDFELAFLSKAKIYKPGNPSVDGAAVWQLYRNVLSNPNADFIAKKIEQKIMQGLLAKFSFSFFASDKNRASLQHFCDQETSLEDYYYLSHCDEVYSLETGLNETVLHNPDPII